MGTKLTLTLTALALLLAIGAADVSAQVVYGQPAAGGLRFVYNSWKVENNDVDTTISQFLTPLFGFVPLAENADLSFYAASSSNRLEKPDATYKLNGLTDIRLQGRHSFADDRILVGLGVSLPTGKKELETDERQVLAAISQNFIELPMRRLGEGFGFNLMIGGATMLGENVKGGLGLSYNYVGKYKPYKRDDTMPEYNYNPGDVIALNGSAEMVNGDMSYMLNLIYSFYTTDKSETDGSSYNSFRQSPSLDARFGVSRKGDVISYGGLLRYVLRGDNKYYEPNTDTEWPVAKFFGNEFSLGGSLGWTMAENWTVSPVAEIRMIGKDDIGVDKATIFGFGASAGRGLGENVNVNAGFKLYTGSVKTFPIYDPDATTSSDLSGYQLTFGLTASM